MCQKDVLGFQIAMNDSVLFKQDQTAQKLLRKSPHNIERETTEGVGLDEFVEIHVKKLSRDTQMTAEVETLCEVNHAVFVFWILKMLVRAR